MWKLLGKVDLIVYEQEHHRGGAATFVALGLITELQAFAAEQEVEVMNVHSATLKKFATGNGRASKEDMLRNAREYGYFTDDDNEADAALLLEYTLCDFKEDRSRG